MGNLYRILVAEDHQRTRFAWTELITSWGFVVEAAEDGRRATELIDSFEPHVLLLDLKMPFKDGLEVLGEIREKRLPIATIVISGEGDIFEAVQAVKNGAYDYLRKPIDPERLHMMVNNLCNQISMDEENRRLRMHLMNAGKLGPLIGQSLAMRRVMALVAQAAPSTASLIICGESGTGKEIVARTIHEMSPRCNGPCVAVNCAALPETLLESELFGHERGAFTGADQRRKGCFELARGGTLLLDEIGEMKPEIQAKLLRVLEERKLRRLGGSSDITLDVRVLAATNRSLSEAIRNGCLREDLYYRLNVITIDLPQLSERVDDIPLLAETFIREFAKANAKTVAGADSQCIETLKSRDWPGNVRELRNVIERAVILSTRPLLTARDVCSGGLSHPAARAASVSSGAGLRVGRAIKEVERELILNTLEMVKGSRLRAAEILGISPKTLYNKLGRYHFKEERPQSRSSVDRRR